MRAVFFVVVVMFVVVKQAVAKGPVGGETNNQQPTTDGALAVPRLAAAPPAHAAPTQRVASNHGAHIRSLAVYSALLYTRSLAKYTQLERAYAA